MFILFVFFLCFSLELFPSNDNSEFQSSAIFVYNNQFNKAKLSDEILICTRPCTGTSLVITILNQLTKKNCFWTFSDFFEFGTFINRANIKIDTKQTSLLGSHEIRHFKNLQNNKLIVTLRDYKDLFLPLEESSNEEIEAYYALLELFDNWKSNDRFLVRYENLINAPFEIVDGLGSFLSCKTENIKEFKNNFEMLRSKTLKSRMIFPKYKSKSREFKNLKITEKNKLEQIQKLEKLMKKKNPFLYKKYLTQYTQKSINRSL